MKTYYALTRADYEREVDAAIADSFPASDPLPWTFGASPWMALETPGTQGPVAAAVDTIVSDGGRGAAAGLSTLAQLIVLMALVPVAILLVGVPVVVLARGIVRLGTWLISGS